MEEAEGVALQIARSRVSRQNLGGIGRPMANRHPARIADPAVLTDCPTMSAAGIGWEDHRS